jgi:hypothetical protein
MQMITTDLYVEKKKFYNELIFYAKWYARFPSLEKTKLTLEVWRNSSGLL